MEANNFHLGNYFLMVDLMSNLRDSTIPKNPEVDSTSIDLMWYELNAQLLNMANHFKEQLVTKEFVEKHFGKKVQTFEKVYDKDGVLTGVNVVPVMVAEYITINFTITPTDDAKDIK